MTTPKRAVIYARTSKKRTQDPWASIPQQIEALRGLAGRWGCEVVAEFREEMTGASSERPHYQDMMRLIREGIVNTILVVRFDRLTRTERLGEFEDVKDELRALGCELITYDMGKVELGGGANAEFTTDVLAAAAKAERLKTRERTKSGREAKALSGRYYGYILPLGYKAKYDEQGAKSIVEDPDTAPLIRRIFTAYAQGDTFSNIRDRLEAEGIPTPTGNAVWHASTIRRILENTNYIGVLAFGKKVNAAPALIETPDFPALVDPATWDLVQERLRVGAVRNHRGPNKPFPLTGTLRCGGCDGKMTTSRYANGYHYYRCQSRVGRRNKPCPAPEAFSVPRAHAAVLAFLQAELPRYALGLDTPGRTVTMPLDAVAVARRRIEELERERTAIIRRTAALGDDEILAALRPIREEINAQKAQMEALAAKANAPAPDRSALAPLIAEMEHIDPSDPEALRGLFGATLLRLYLKKQGHGQHYRQIIAVDRAVLITDETLSTLRE